MSFYNPFEINKLKPVPSKDFVANFVNNLGNISGSIPVPVSFTLTTASTPIDEYW
jgi:hypothetical protein